MSKYTTEVRYICEQKAGYDESKGFNSVDEILNESWNKIFTTNATFYDPAYKPIICKKILKHYYTREIAAETVGLWMLWMNTKLEEILPYYNKLWSSALLEFDPFKDVDYTKTGEKKGTKTEEQSGQFSTNGNASNTRTDNLTETTTHGRTNTNYNLFSETPQGALNGVDSQTYLTDARKITDTEGGTTKVVDTGTQGNTGTNSQSGTDSRGTEGETTEDYTERIAGKMNSISYSELLMKLRETFINIDLLVIDEFKDMFMNIY